MPLKQLAGGGGGQRAGGRNDPMSCMSMYE
jgi:hypothetical protein